jgi:hypothetical protein
MNGMEQCTEGNVPNFQFYEWDCEFFCIHYSAEATNPREEESRIPDFCTWYINPVPILATRRSDSQA